MLLIEGIEMKALAGLCLVSELTPAPTLYLFTGTPRYHHVDIKFEIWHKD